MKKETNEKIEEILVVILVFIIIVMARVFTVKDARKSEMQKAHIDSLEAIALKVDSLENVVGKYSIPSPYWEIELDANCKEFAKEFEKKFGRDSLTKVVIVGTTNRDGSLKWSIKTQQN